MDREYLRAQVGVAGAPGSTWLADESTHYPPVTEDISVDVLVIGAGIVGTLVTHELASRGLSVALLERRRVAGGTTGHSTAKITVLHDTSWTTRLRRRGLSAELIEWARLNAATPSAIGELVARYGIECGYRRLDAHLMAASRSAEPAVADALRALQRLEVPVEDLGRLPEAPLGGERCIRVADQAQFDPAAFVTGLVGSLPPGQVTVAESSAVRSLVRQGALWRAHLDHGTVSAPHAVMTALAPVRDPALLFTRLYPYSAYVFEFVPATPPPDGFWIQAGDDELTLRPTGGPDGSWIAAGQHVRNASQADERAVYERLQRAVESQFPGCRFVRHWSTHDLWTPDWSPFVGRVGARDGLYMIGGFGAWGMSASLPAARLVADAITGSPNEPLLRFLSPNRVPGLRSLPSFLREAAIVARRYTVLTAPQKHAPAVPGVTAVAEDTKMPRCTHLGCRLKVDTAEATIDCPCHGSRFTGSGSALYGPAQRDLKQ